MAAVLGGAQSLHTNSLDEAWALPSEHAVTLALRTQQVIAYESGVTAAPDPFGGSYFLEHLTLELEAGAREYIRQHRRDGRHDRRHRAGFPQSEIAAPAMSISRGRDGREAIIVGVNRYQTEAEKPIETLRIDQSAQNRQSEKLRRLRKRRNNGDVERGSRSLSARRGRRNASTI